MADRDHGPDRTAAIDAVQRAMAACRAAQGRLGEGQTILKADMSPVTIADLAAQVVVNATLAEAFGDAFAMVAEEDPETARADPQIARAVAELAESGLGHRVDDAEVARVLGLGRGDGRAPSRFWTLDPIDGTKGFIRGDQYAVALALIEHGTVVLGALGCPNLPNPDGSIGALLIADEQSAEIITDTGRSPARVHSPERLSEARLCESVEAAHSDQHLSARIAAVLGIETEPYRIDSQCKYAAVARGDASIYLRLPTRPDYRENIWDHAPGAIAVTRAGGRVTDVHGAPLEFSHGARLERNHGIVATDGRFHDEVIDAIAEILGEHHSD
jgi:3'(2'), 5'-bisphosphate nucleotidase